MTDTPITDAALTLCVRDEELVTHPLYDHARKMERDRARLIKALRWYGKANGFSLLGDAGFMARDAIAEVEKTQ